MPIGNVSLPPTMYTLSAAPPSGENLSATIVIPLYSFLYPLLRIAIDWASAFLMAANLLFAFPGVYV